MRTVSLNVKHTLGYCLNIGVSRGLNQGRNVAVMGPAPTKTQKNVGNIDESGCGCLC